MQIAYLISSLGYYVYAPYESRWKGRVISYQEALRVLVMVHAVSLLSPEDDKDTGHQTASSPSQNGYSTGVQTEVR